MRRLILATVVLGAFLTGGCGHNPPELTILVGLAGVDLQEDGPDSPVIDDRIGGRTSIGLEWPLAGADRVTGDPSGFRLGGRFTASGYQQNIRGRTVAGEPLLTIEDFVNLGIYSLQATASYRQVWGQPLQGGGGFFLEPGIATGPAVGVLSFGSDLEFGNRVLGRDISRNEAEFGWATNPYLRLGYIGDRFRIGAEGGYQWTWATWDENLGTDPREWYVGLFVGMQLGQ